MWNASSKIEVRAKAKLNENDTQRNYDFLHIHCVCARERGSCVSSTLQTHYFLYHNKYGSSMANDFQIKSRPSGMSPILCSSFRRCVVVFIILLLSFHNFNFLFSFVSFRFSCFVFHYLCFIFKAMTMIFCHRSRSSYPLLLTRAAERMNGFDEMWCEGVPRDQATRRLFHLRIVVVFLGKLEKMWRWQPRWIWDKKISTF